MTRQAMQAAHPLEKIFSATHALAFAVLIGSRASGTARDGSDWDIAVLWQPGQHANNGSTDAAVSAGLMQLARHEELRHRLAQCLNVADEKIDLIDLTRASLTMKAAVVDEGQTLAVNDARAWAYFQVAVWRALEDFYWERTHAV